jgi:transcriptional regulator with XRE-family HTH domain
LSVFGEPPPQRKRLASALRRLRRRAGLSGEELARRAGWSQSKVSRLETAQSPPSAEDVRRWCEFVHASDDERDDLLDLAPIVASEVLQWKRSGRQGLARLQRDAADLEATSSAVRAYTPVVIPGLLQTADYARRMFEGLYLAGPRDVSEAVAARLERQSVLFDPTKTFEFIVTEAALGWCLGPRQAKLAQLDRIVSVVSQTHVAFGVLPLDNELPTWHWHDFTIYEPRAEPSVVEIETLTCGLTISDPADVQTYVDVFARLRAAAVGGEEALALVRRHAERLA